MINSMKTKLNKDKGFTLLEVLAGVAILGLISVPLLTYFTQSIVTAGESREMREKTAIASSLMETAVAVIDSGELDEEDDFADAFDGSFNEGNFDRYDDTERNGHKINLQNDDVDDSIEINSQKDINDHATLVKITVTVDDYTLETLRILNY